MRTPTRAADVPGPEWLPGAPAVSGMPEYDLTRTDRGPLRGIVVLDVSRTLAGPFCTMLLGDMGATIIKIESPGEGDPARTWPPFLRGHSTYFMGVNRNKRSITLDLAQATGQRLLARMASRADVFVENFKCGSLKRFGLDFESLQQVSPRLIYCSISGYGQTGPRRHEAAFDLTIQAESGIMDVTGASDGPPAKVGVPLTDVTAGLYAANGILAALRARDATGRGQMVDVALFDAALSLLTFHASSVLASIGEPRRMGNAHPSLAPYETFRASDGEFALGVATEALWKSLCDVLNPEGFLPEAGWETNASRIQHRESLHARLQDVFSTRPAERWLLLLRSAAIPCGAINSVRAALSGEQAEAREMVRRVPHADLGEVGQLGIPVKLSDTPGSLRRSPPRLGEHNEEIYRQWLGLSEIELEELRVARVI
ncbi:MAG TPA: CoA transferase [Thermoanaerobaculia bacterium]|nr:CoA transferase [Thermoanaerobaculia bacterium]